MQVTNDYLQSIIDGKIGIIDSQYAVKVAAELVAARMALRAHQAWSWSEKSKLSGLVSFQAKMELCNYAEHLTSVALGDCAEYVGVPRLMITPEFSAHIVRADAENCESLIDQVFDAWRKAEE